MKKRIFQIFLVIVMLLTICSCTEQGEPGLNGANGKSAYEIAVENGFKGTVTQWLESLKGEQGPQGEKGEDGASAEVIDTSLTVLTFNIPAEKLSLDLRGIYRSSENAGGLTQIDWGDGVVASIDENEDVMKHTYAEAGEYTVTLTGITQFGRAALRAQSALSGVTFGDIVTVIGEIAFDECSSLSEIVCLGEYPPEIAKNSFNTTDSATTTRITKLTVPTDSALLYVESWSQLAYAIELKETSSSALKTDIIVTVGQDGDYGTINGALAYLSAFYPVYKSGGIKCVVEIIGGTVINEQIFVEQIDLSYITISTSASDNTVKVDTTGWGGVTHDTRGNRPFFSAENGGRLPAIDCLFSCITPEGGWTENNGAVGYFCNRGSSGVILGSTTKEVGFEGFYDNIIANNNSEIVLREAVARNAARYGVMSRHISRVSARSADITGCGDVAAYADRVSTMDIRHADLSGSFRAIVAYNASTVTANETVANNLTGYWAIDSRQGSIVNCADIKINGANSVFNIDVGGTIIATNAVLENVEKSLYSATPNAISEKGIIYN